MSESSESDPESRQSSTGIQLATSEDSGQQMITSKYKELEADHHNVDNRISTLESRLQKLELEVQQLSERVDNIEEDILSREGVIDCQPSTSTQLVTSGADEHSNTSPNGDNEDVMPCMSSRIAFLSKNLMLPQQNVQQKGPQVVKITEKPHLSHVSKGVVNNSSDDQLVTPADVPKQSVTDVPKSIANKISPIKPELKILKPNVQKKGPPVKDKPHLSGISRDMGNKSNGSKGEESLVVMTPDEGLDQFFGKHKTIDPNETIRDESLESISTQSSGLLKDLNDMKKAVVKRTRRPPQRAREQEREAERDGESVREMMCNKL